MPEERKLVTVLVADIVGSTGLTIGHDPEVTRAAFWTIFVKLREVIELHGGTVEKFIGDAVMAVFGIPTTHEDDADRAVRAAFALHRCVAEVNRTAQLQLRIRVGVNTGEAVTGSGEGSQHLVTGAPVITAFRLQTAAVADEILVGALTRDLTEATVRYESSRSVQAKGLGVIDVWPAVEALGEPPQTRLGGPGLSAPLIGRETELRRIEEVMQRVRTSGGPGLVTILGPAGIGKSRLLGEALAHASGLRVRSGRCLPYGEGITFYPVQLIVRAECGIELTDTRSVAISKLEGSMADVLDDPDQARGVAARVATLVGLTTAAEALPDMGEAEITEELRWGARRFFECRAAHRPIALVFEDLQWAEPRLLELIDYIAESSRAPVVVLCVARPELRDEHPAFGTNVSNAAALTIGPLATAQASRLTCELLRTSVLPNSVRAVVSRAEGNPLYVEELLKTCIETGRIVQRDGQWVDASVASQVPVPPTLVGLIAARLDRVSPDLKRMLQRASLAGRLFSTSGLAAIGGEPVARKLLHEAVHRDLLIESTEPAVGTGEVYRFRHVLIRDVAYATVTKAERSRLHGNYAHWLESTLGDRQDEVADIIAFHLEQAFLFSSEIGLPTATTLGPRAFEVLIRAATHARHRDDPAAAVSLYERAAVVAELLVADHGVLANVRGWATVMRWRLEPRNPALDAALDDAYAAAAAAGPSEVLMAIIAERAHRANDAGMPAAMNDAYDEAVRVALDVGDAELIGDAIVERAWGWYLQGDVDRYAQALERCRAHLASTGATRALLRCVQGLGRVARIRGEFSAAHAYQREAIAVIPRGGSKHVEAATAQASAQLAYDIGDLASAVRDGETALAAARESGVPRAIGFAAWVLGEILIDTGDAARARAVLEEATAIFEARQARSELPEVHGRCARACLRQGDIVAAREHVFAAERDVLPTDAEAMQITGIAAAELAEAEGDASGADARWRETIARLLPTRIGKRTAAAQLLYGTFLVRHGHAIEARAQLLAAREFFRDPIARRRVDQIDALLIATGTLTS